jgi:hypothetical protein
MTTPKQVNFKLRLRNELGREVLRLTYWVDYFFLKKNPSSKILSRESLFYIFFFNFIIQYLVDFEPVSIIYFDLFFMRLPQSLTNILIFY